MQIVRIVIEGKTRLRAKAEDGKNVRFPRRLRLVGSAYMVERLTPLASGKSWNASGLIKRVS